MTKPIRVPQHPGLPSHPDHARATMTDRLVRISAGIEDTADLIADLAQALERPR